MCTGCTWCDSVGYMVTRKDEHLRSAASCFAVTKAISDRGNKMVGQAKDVAAPCSADVAAGTLQAAAAWCWAIQVPGL